MDSHKMLQGLSYSQPVASTHSSRLVKKHALLKQCLLGFVDTSTIYFVLFKSHEISIFVPKVGKYVI